MNEARKSQNPSVDPASPANDTTSGGTSRTAEVTTEKVSRTSKTATKEELWEVTAACFDNYVKEYKADPYYSTWSKAK